MNINKTNDSENKKVSKKSKRCKFWIELPNEEFKNNLQIEAKKRGLNQKEFMAKIIYEYALNEKIQENIFIRELEKYLKSRNIHYNKNSFSQYEKDKFKQNLIEFYNYYVKERFF